MNWKTLEEARARLASEEGAVFKDWGGRNSVALIYPNSYFLGMSNLGFQSIYGLLNQYDRVVCERVFQEGNEPVSLESQRPLGDFDVLAFSFSYEHDYFNAASILKSSGIPLFTSERDERHPLIVAGGAAVTANPEPMSEIVDCFAIGEAEAILPGMIPVLLDGMESPRPQFLKELAKAPGLYVPAIGNNPVRQFPADIGSFPTGSVVLTPDTELGDMYLMEIARGCNHGCRFCLSGYHFRPMRYRRVEQLLKQAEEGLRFRRRIGLVSAAISDHPQIDELVSGLRNMGGELSASSVRIKPLSDTLLRGLAESGTRTITLAPEAGTQRLRQVISKGISEEDILDTIRRVAGYDFRQIKLYFMIGLPAETDDDIIAIVGMAQSAKSIIDGYRSGTHLTLNVTPFVPKAGTPFQWLPMARAAVLKRRLALLRKNLRPKGIEVKSDSIGWSLVQGKLARGDSSLGKVIESMPKVSLAAWQKALKEAGIDPESVHQQIAFDSTLPWAHIDSGTGAGKLRSEMEKALSGEIL
ncbi:MAG: radical SAM protein [Dehalococcoidia bacterium]